MQLFKHLISIFPIYTTCLEQDRNHSEKHRLIVTTS